MTGDMLVVMQEQQCAVGLDGEDKYLRARTTHGEIGSECSSKYVEYGNASSLRMGMPKNNRMM